MASVISGNLRKMEVSLASPVEYYLNLYNGDKVNLIKFLGKQITLAYSGGIECIACGKSIKKSYQQGYCFPCTQKLAACDMCILKPVLCHYHHGTCRQPDWGQEHCMVPHIVYLADTGTLKVGITRETQVPTRWIDQGANCALPIIRVQSRWQSGLLEDEFATIMADKTNWRKMLQYTNYDPEKLQDKRDETLAELQGKIQQIAGKFSLGDIEILTNEQPVTINYPILEIPKIVSLSLDKTQTITGKLLGIKGQYLLLDCGVINIRRHTGYELSFYVGNGDILSSSREKSS